MSETRAWVPRTSPVRTDPGCDDRPILESTPVLQASFLKMKIATWNVNSIRARLDRVKAWLSNRQPDLVCLQETKVEDQAFPKSDFESLGYHVAVHGQKTYNGVAFLSKHPPVELVRGMGDAVADPQARFLIGSFQGVRVGTLYVPNGQAVGTEKFAYKLAWLARWKSWVQSNADPTQPWLFCGDFNIAPDDRDVYDPAGWKDQVLCHPDERRALQDIVSLGFLDLFRKFHQEKNLYTWWDYRQLGFPKNRGLRIDHMFCSTALANRCSEIIIDRDERKGASPSDHAPVVAVFDPL
jgi:exodeoxyribonuclease III